MASLKNRRGSWYARVLWYKHGETRQTEKQVPLKTKSKVEARERLSVVNKVENDIKEGIEFSFPWLNNEGCIKVCVFRFNDAVDQWMEHRKKNKIRKKTLEINQLALSYFMDCNGSKRPLSSIGNTDIANYIDYLDARGNSDTTINIL